MTPHEIRHAHAMLIKAVCVFRASDQRHWLLLWRMIHDSIYRQRIHFLPFFSFDLMHWFEKHTVINRRIWQFIYMHIAFLTNAQKYIKKKKKRIHIHRAKVTPPPPVYCINGLTSNIFLFPLLRGSCVFQSQCVLFNKYIFGTWTRGRPKWFM